MTVPVESWGRWPQRPPARTAALHNRHDPLPDAGGQSLLPYGNGRSYGDSCQNQDGVLLLTRGLDRYIELDFQGGVLRCESGVLFDDILRRIVPHGWYLPVVPGTRLITVGGAIANDIHGKNHPAAGSFGCHVRSFELLRSDGRRLLCSPDANPDLYAATIGGLGLTGLITWAEIALMPIPGPWLTVECRRFHDLAEYLALSDAALAEQPFQVAWFDCLAPPGQRGRGVFTSARFEADATGVTVAATPARTRLRATVPFTPPFSLLGGFGLRRFNRWYFQRRRQAQMRQHHLTYFYPLDAMGHWNRLYGPRGFLQHQSLLPPGAEPALAEMLDVIAEAGQGSFLAVLKRFGARRSPGLLSFPRAGTTLALDFPFRGQPTLDLLTRLDDIVAAAGGALYPAKDARMSGAHFRQYFPAWCQFAEHVDPAFSSSFWRRVTEPGVEPPCPRS